MQKIIETNSQFGPIHCFENDLITSHIIKYGNHTRPEFSFATSVLDCGHRIFDLGAHIGTFSLAAAKKLGPEQEILAVEGNSNTFDLLTRNLARYVGPSAACINAFIGADDPLVYKMKNGNSGAGHLVPANDLGSIKDIVSLSLDDLAGSYFLPQYIKIDVEGLEYRCLSSSEALRDTKPIVYTEVNKQQLELHGNTISDLNKLFNRLGYRYFVNVGDRNGRHDLYHAEEISNLEYYKGFFDALCVPVGSDCIYPLERSNRMNKCSIPDDHIAPRRLALFMARSVLNEVRDGRSTC